MLESHVLLAVGVAQEHRLDLRLTDAHKVAIINAFSKNPPQEVAKIKKL